jgi:DNA-binding response OmpR family regulator
MSDALEGQKTAVIVEDDPDVRHLLVEVLEAAGFSTVSVGNGIDGVRAVLAYQPLITTLDVNMPGIDGFEAARRIRKSSNTFIVMLTGLADEADVVLGLGAGADEYIVKPFRPREFRARVEALLRRPRPEATNGVQPRQESSGPSFPGTRGNAPAGTMSAGPSAQDYPAARDYPAEAAMPNAAGAPTHPLGTAPQTPASGLEAMPSAPGSDVALTPSHPVVPGGGYWITHRDLQLNPDTRIVLIGGQEVELTRTEFDLLATLMESKRRVRSKADLTLVLRGESYVTSYYVGEADKRAVEAHMTNLRRKLGDNPTNPRYVETVRGVGYRLTTELLAP